LRHQLHAHPELSGQESWTAAFIVTQLQQMGITKIYTQFAQHSVLAEIEGQNKGKTILFRCELDALPIQEVNLFEYRSVKSGVSHKCGHDGHCATMLAFAQKLMDQPITQGKILLFFQSAEEIGAGARIAIESKIFDAFSIDFVFAYHNLPSFPLGSVICKKGVFTPSVESFSVKFMGKSCHASVPEYGVCPATAIAALIQNMNQWHQPDKTKPHYFVATPIHIQMGERAYGTMAGFGEVGYTIRTWESRILYLYKQQIIQTIHTICTKEGLTFEISWFESFQSNTNDVAAFEQIKLASIHNQLSFIEIAQPLDFGEDFGLFTNIYKGAMFGLGSGENCPALHSSDYDFPDELIDIGGNLFYAICEHIGTVSAS
jgi:amidohydrolase